MKILNYLLEKWKLQNFMQVLAILMVFALSGSTVVLLKPLYFNLIGIVPSTPFLLKLVCYIIFIFPSYQLLLIGYGWVFGQKRFFRNKMRQTIRKLSFKSSSIVDERKDHISHKG